MARLVPPLLHHLPRFLSIHLEQRQLSILLPSTSSRAERRLRKPWAKALLASGATSPILRGIIPIVRSKLQRMAPSNECRGGPDTMLPHSSTSLPKGRGFFN